VNKTVFQSVSSLPVANVVNEAGGKAYNPGPRHALAQYAVTGTFNGTFYATADEQLKNTLELAKGVDNEFLAKVAVYSREVGNMKDMPACLLAVLSLRNANLFDRIFNRVITNGDMLRRFVQIVRSGAVGRKSLGSGPKRKIREWLANRKPERLVFDSIGSDPSLGDVINLAHPRANDEKQNAMFAWLIGKSPVAKVDDPKHQVDVRLLPAALQTLESFKANKDGELPNVPFQMLTALPLSDKHWTEIARTASWTMTRMNLNTFHRHGVLKDPEMVKLLAARLSNKEEVAKSRVFPYQLLNTYLAVAKNEEIPMSLRLALQDALEHATLNVPAVGVPVIVAPDVSGSMTSPATGVRQGATSTARCLDVAALVASTMLRVNPETVVLPFDTEVHKVALNPRDSVMTNAQKLALNGGGTNCAKPIEYANVNGLKADLFMLVSDNQSWVNSDRHAWALNHANGVVNAWKVFKRNNPKAKLVCIDMQPYGSVQAPDNKDILNIGGFSDTVFTTVANFVKGGNDHWVDEIQKIEV
jgi:60 kDa SS-A/Ro ribonucleoprotein